MYEKDNSGFGYGWICNLGSGGTYTYSGTGGGYERRVYTAGHWANPSAIIFNTLVESVGQGYVDVTLYLDWKWSDLDNTCFTEVDF